MKAMAILLCLWICLSPSINVCGQSKSRRTSNKPSAAKGSVPREQAMNDEARKLESQFWDKLIRCGSSYFLYSDDRLFEFRDSPHFSFTGQSLKPKPLSRVEILNGVDPLPIEWDGGTKVSFEVCRMNTSYYGYGRTFWHGWRKWSNQNCEFGTRIWREKGKWNISALKQISCDDLAGWGFTAKPIHKAILLAPKLLSPTDGTVLNNPYPRKTKVEWAPVNGAASYTVEIQFLNAGEWSDLTEHYSNYPESGYSPPVKIKETSFTFEWVGTNTGRWRVWAIDSKGNEGVKSAWREFRYRE